MSCFYCCTTSLFKLSESKTQKYRMWQQTLKSVLNWVSRWVSSFLTSHVYIHTKRPMIWCRFNSSKLCTHQHRRLKLQTVNTFNILIRIKYQACYINSPHLNVQPGFKHSLAARFTPVSFPENISMSLNVTNCCQAAIVSTGSHGAFMSTWRTAGDGVTCRWVFDNRSLSHHSGMTSQLWFI